MSLLALEELTDRTPSEVQASLLEKLTILASAASHNAQKEYPSTQYAFTIDGHRITGEDIKAKAQQIADWTEPEVLVRKRSYFLAIASDRNENYINRYHAYQDLVKVADRYEELGYTQEYLILANEINEITQELLRIKEEQLRSATPRKKPQPTTKTPTKRKQNFSLTFTQTSTTLVGVLFLGGIIFWLGFRFGGRLNFADILSTLPTHKIKQKQKQNSPKNNCKQVTKIKAKQTKF